MGKGIIGWTGGCLAGRKKFIDKSQHKLYNMIHKERDCHEKI